MKNIFFVSIFATICLVISSVGNNPPKIESSTAKNTPVEAIKVEPIVADSATSPQPEVKPEVKPEDVTDGVWEQKDLVARYFPKSELINALRIMSKENGSADPERVSVPNKDKWKSRDYGLFQLNDHWQGNRVGGDVEQFKNPETNVKIAYNIWSESGNSWRLWSTAKKLGLN